MLFIAWSRNFPKSSWGTIFDSVGYRLLGMTNEYSSCGAEFKTKSDTHRSVVELTDPIYINNLSLLFTNFTTHFSNWELIYRSTFRNSEISISTTENEKNEL